MKISGTAALKASPQQVWDAFHDPEVLARCLPGCESLTEVGPDEYAMTVTAGVAAIKGTYEGKVALLNPQHPEQFTMKAQGAGGPGHGRRRRRGAPRALGGGRHRPELRRGRGRRRDDRRGRPADARRGHQEDGRAVLRGGRRRHRRRARKEKKKPHPRPPSVPAGPRPIDGGRGTSDGSPVGARRARIAWGVVSGGAIALLGVIVGWAIGGR